MSSDINRSAARIMPLDAVFGIIGTATVQSIIFTAQNIKIVTHRPFNSSIDRTVEDVRTILTQHFSPIL